MKKLFKSLLSAALCLGLTFAGAACGDTGGEQSSDPSTEGKTEINVSVYAAGYGTGWIDEACKIYTQNHPEYYFRVKANSGMFDENKTTLGNDTCKSDVVLIAGYDYLTLSMGNHLLELSDVYSSKIPDSDKTVREAVAKEQYEYRLVGESKDRIYGIPWQDTGANGFVYNKKMFAEHNWQIPTTMDEYFELCDKITESGITPLVYGGGTQDGYVSMNPTQWLVQYYGYDYMQNTFEKYENVDQYKYTEAGRTKAYETLARVLKGTSPSGKPYALAQSKSYQPSRAQAMFIDGAAAMCICGPWFRTETRKQLESSGFECGYIPLPHINADKKDVNGNDSSNVTYSLAANLLAIPKTSKHPEVAKDFLISMFTKESYTSYVVSNNGVTRPINVEVDESKLDDYAKTVYAGYAAGKASGECVYETSSSPMSINGYLALINLQGTHYSSIINSASYADALKIAKDASAADYNRALSFWDANKKQWKEEYLTIK